MAQDIKIKRAEYISKNCELNQEFIEKSVKIAPKQLLNFIVKDMRSVTGKNLKRILFLTNKRKFDDLNDADIDKILMGSQVKNVKKSSNLHALPSRWTPHGWIDSLFPLPLLPWFSGLPFPQ